MTTKARAKEVTVTRACRHCGGDGAEPGALKLAFSREGERRGDLKKLADICKVSEPMISQMIAGKKTPSARTLVMIAAGLSRVLGESVTVERLVRMPAVWKRIHTAKR